jgi:NADH-quinone oxidoreductase subunit L
VICLLLFMGAMGKSAQFLLHTWLPDAMEGPTPVSALIHAATMVTAGVFMVARMSPLFELAPDRAGRRHGDRRDHRLLRGHRRPGAERHQARHCLFDLFAARLHVRRLGVGAYGAGIFHLFTHAFFKALLFLGAGSVIHAVSDEQDMRNMGGLRKNIPMTYCDDVIGTLALTGVGIPGTLFGTAGFFSKDAIIESAYVGENAAAGFAFGLLVIAALFTSFYSWRLIFMTFHGKPRASADVMHHVHESPPVMLVPLYVLAAGALLAGLIFHDFFIGHAAEAADHAAGWYNEFWRGALFAGPDNHILEEFHHVPWAVKLSPFIVMLIGLVTAWYMYIRSPQTPKDLAAQHEGLYKFLLNKWYFDELYDFLFVKPAMRLGTFLWKRGDGWLIDGFGPDGVAARVRQVTGRVVRLQTGYLYHYAFAMLIGVAALVTWMMLGGSV